ncbi:F-box protein family-like protein [Carex littledalei]|uniref:F-box protein family-like protein n=1 Tax=Carex littledalei TaxID=544730 RepID=A0A833W0L0_9POAL|nr:F-box protein family-like protein [Carex littledalei]
MAIQLEIELWSLMRIHHSLLMGCCRWTILQMPNRIAGGWYVTSRLRGNPINYTIHRLETSDQTWERVKSIGGCVFFLSGIQSTALSAAQAGTQPDCIYVVNQNYDILRGEGVYKICLWDQTISLSLSDHAPYVLKEYKKEEKCIIDITRPWADMPNELVQLLLPYLYLVDYLRLPSICKAWNSLFNPIQDAKVYPWLMYPMDNNSCLWRLFDPLFEKEYYIDMKWLGSSKDLTFHYSKDGWVLVSKEDNSLFLINPLTRAIISLPHFDNFRYTAISFSLAPTCLDCVVFVLLFTSIHVLEISTWSPGEREWSKMIFNDQYHEYFHYVPCSPVFAHGEFYCYRLSGELSVYNPKEKTLRTIEIKAPLKMDLFTSKLMDCHLIESEGGFILCSEIVGRILYEFSN